MKREISLAKTAAATLAMAILAAALLIVAAPSPAQAHPSTFPDVAETNPAHDAVESLTARGILDAAAGANFEPNVALSRGQAIMALITWRGDQYRDNRLAAPSLPFTDVSPDYGPYVAVAYAQGWIGGYPDTTFRPDSPLTREQMAIVMIRSTGLERQALALTETQIAATLGRFLDQGAISPPARPYAALAVIRGLLSGSRAQLQPQGILTRAHFALIVTRADNLTLDDPAGAFAPRTGAGQDPLPGSTLTADEAALAGFIDTYLFQPHNSPVTGQMVLQNADWYGIPPLSQLVIMAAETSLGDPNLGGALARSNNFGCLRYGGSGSPWGMLSNGSLWVAGKQWYSFPTPQLGMAAWGRYLKVGANGFYAPILAAARPDWERFAAVYYGSGVAGFGAYVNRLHTIENRFKTMAAQHEVSF